MSSELSSSVVELLSRLRGLDVKVWSENGDLRFSAPPDVVGPALREELTRRKPELLEFLRASRGASRMQPVLRAVDRDRRLPLSFAQERLWFLDQMDPGMSAYNLVEAVRLTGPLDRCALEGSLVQLRDRHEALRTRFPSVDGQPLQEILPLGPLRLEVEDLSGLAAAERQKRASIRAAEEARRPFDLARGPLFRVGLWKLAETDHLLLLAMHHIVSDGWSLALLLQELGALYGKRVSGAPSSLAPLALQYADYAVWQREVLAGEGLADSLVFWKRTLEGELPVLEIPADRPRPASQTFRGASQPVVVSPEVARKLRHLARREGATLFMTLLAAFDVWLHRYTRQSDILVGTPVSSRTRVETEPLVGLFVNTVVLRTDLSGDPSFRELLSRVRETTLEAFAHQDVPFEKVVDAVQPERTASRNPIFQVLFALERDGDAPRLPGLALEPVELDTGISQFDLTWEVTERGDELSGWLEYSTELFDPATAERLAANLQTLLEGIAADPGRPISRLPLLTDGERRRLLVEWNETAGSFPCDARVEQLIERQAERSPDALAVLSPAGAVRFRELNERANRLAHHLRGRGIGPGSAVGVFLERSIESVVALVASFKAGAAYVPLEIDYPRERLAYLLQDSSVALVLTRRSLLDELPAGTTALCIDAEADKIARESGENPPAESDASHPAYILHTSGSTGRPKGVVVPHRAVVNHLFWMQVRFPLTSADRVLQKTAVSFDVSVWELFAPLCFGAQLVLVGPQGHHDVTEIAQAVREENVTVLQVVPAMLRPLLEEGAFDGGSVRRVFCGGAPMTPDLKERFLRRSGVELYNMYGPTETTIDATCYRCPVDPGSRSVPIGRPIANARAYVLDGWLTPVPIGVEGELYIAGAGVASGYQNLPELTAEKFVPDPYSPEPGSRLYRTGDRARFQRDGNLEFLGRFDDQIKLRGYRIELGEIEAVLSEHPGVRDAVVAVREAGPADRRLVAYVVPDWSPQPTFSELRGFLAERLPDHMLPAAFVLIEELPRLPSGKIDRSALPAPEPTRPDLQRRYVAPRDALELQLSKIWEKVLGVRPVGMRDNFFQLGGHSLLAVRLFAAIEKATGKKLPLATLFQAPTVGQLAQILRDGGWMAPWSSLVPIQAGGSNPPFYCIHAAGGNVLTYHDLSRYMGPDQPVYGLQAQGLDGRRPPHDRVEEMAAHYVAEIRALQPEGPYYLGGASAGGIVAFEMARQLAARGSEVALIALFDTWGPDYGELLPGVTRAKLKLYATVERLELHLGNLLVGTPRQKLAYFREKGRRLRRRLRARLRDLRSGHLPRDLRGVENATRTALDAYVGGVYPGRVTLFRATRQPSGYSSDPTLGWSRVAAGGVEIHEVPGHHGAILYEPRIRVLADKLKNCIDRSRSAAAVPENKGLAAAGEQREWPAEVVRR